MRTGSVVKTAASIVFPVGVFLYAYFGGGRMLGGSFFLGLATLALVRVSLAVIDGAAGFVNEEPRAAQAVTGRWRKVLNRERQLVVKAIKELELDHEMGKISDADFAEISALYRTRAVRVLRQLDESGGDYRALAEREIKRRALHPGAATVEPEAEIAAAQVPAAASAVERPACSACGTSNDPDAVFCKKCGKVVGATPVAAAAEKSAS